LFIMSFIINSMDFKGQIAIDFLFYIILSLTVGIGLFVLITNAIEPFNEFEENSKLRNMLELVSTTINQVNSGPVGYSQEITLPSKISTNNFFLTINSTQVTIEIGGKKGKSFISPINIVNFNNISSNEIRLVSGEKYSIKKVLNQNNLTGIAISKINI
ncbi:MAG: hypothetical protein ACRC1M_03125, partial [Methanobacteriaceae archaeon]